MKKTSNAVREEIVSELKELKPDNLKEVLDFIFFLKVKQAIAASQAYFWTNTWQKWEEEADEDSKKGRIVGDGTVEGLLKALKS